MEKLTKVAEIKISYTPIKGEKPQIGNSQKAYEEFLPFFSVDTMGIQEQFVVMYLNNANKVIGVYRMSKGGLTGTVVDPRIILGTALKVAATSIMLAHNHPSGQLQPSQADLALTRKLLNAAAFVDIRVNDHLILSGTGVGYYSFADNGDI
jgi:DNA repair protein RadC